jgi:hypothetical protein
MDMIDIIALAEGRRVSSTSYGKSQKAMNGPRSAQTISVRLWKSRILTPALIFTENTVFAE